MTDRMTDERLSEIEKKMIDGELIFLLEKVHELVQAMKSERSDRNALASELAAKKTPHPQTRGAA